MPSYITARRYSALEWSVGISGVVDVDVMVEVKRGSDRVDEHWKIERFSFHFYLMSCHFLGHWALMRL